jgi:hypothetical protein
MTGEVGGSSGTRVPTCARKAARKWARARRYRISSAFGEQPSREDASAWLSSSHTTNRKISRSAGRRDPIARLHLRLEELETGRKCRPTGFVGQSLAKLRAPDGGAPVIGHHPPGNAKQPKTVLGRSRYHVETAPSDRENLGDDVGGVDIINPTPDVLGRCLAVGS